MALFNNLHDVGQDLSALLTDATGIGDVMVGPPIDPPNATGEAIRITLMWLTPQPSHRNDPPEAPGGGPRVRPPVSLSTYFLITTYGTADDDPIQAYNLLGRTLQTFHATPVLDLPGAVATLGEGRLSVVHQTVDPETMEKMFNPLQIVHRPWALFEVAPVQLRHPADELPEEAVVAPGGLRLGGVTVIEPPRVERITPNPARAGARVRIDAHYGALPDHLSLGSVRVPPGGLDIPLAGGPIFADLSAPPADAVGAGAHDLALSVDGTPSDPTTLTLRPADSPGLDAPSPGEHSIASGDLVLTGGGLDTAEAVVLWPHVGLASPADVVEIPTTGAPAAGQVTLAQADVAGAGLRSRLYRVAVRLPGTVFTPWVLLEVRP